eukprot:46088-Eustigmatos_ZCMA.PRE.1
MTTASYVQLAAATKYDINITDDVTSTPFQLQLHKPSEFTTTPKEYVLPGADFGRKTNFVLPND